MIKTSTRIAAFLTISALSSCAQNQLPLPSASPPAPPLASTLSNTPDLSPYTRFEAFSQSSDATGVTEVRGNLKFFPSGGYFELTDTSNAELGVLNVQPDTCHGDPSPSCERSFVINGRIKTVLGILNCLIPVRNDTTLGYAQQALSGVCRTQYGRSLTVNLQSK
ncbi:hypothetical protein [Rhodoferax mekongensis]|uniref:Lipoprotein n=1 Tax=Rhodoferax mekongensis TaxID=3068341 RepID=A0ABZ0AUS7_9BURK|nr:hypothetical protein [Rhodoferax sp. TBRC 17307]WNO03386.1 hypothetical protein RAN89_10645 [Rhodoferax sp. TBRC 17307]